MRLLQAAVVIAANDLPHNFEHVDEHVNVEVGAGVPGQRV
jgi:hypothetical protein